MTSHDAASTPDGAKKTVMVCDDERDILMVYSNFLKRKYNVLTAISGEACIATYKDAIMKGKKIDVLLVDYRLGDMLGDAVACKIRDLDGTKTLLISAYEIDAKLLSDMKERKCIIDELKKPVSMTYLLERIEKILEM